MPTTAENYADTFTSDLAPLTDEVLQYTLANHPQHHMISGKVQGKFLQFISHMMRPRRILEIGTFTGFSALCLAEGLAHDGLLYTLELREADARLAQSFFDRSEYKSQIRLMTGPAMETIATLAHETWDLVFIDADKTGYTGYFDAILPRVRSGGYILADNVLFHGEVLQDTISGKNARAIDAFNRHVKSTPGIEHVLLTVRDGLMLMRKR